MKQKKINERQFSFLWVLPDGDVDEESKDEEIKGKECPPPWDPNMKNNSLSRPLSRCLNPLSFPFPSLLHCLSLLSIMPRSISILWFIRRQLKPTLPIATLSPQGISFSSSRLWLNANPFWVVIIVLSKDQVGEDPMGLSHPYELLGQLLLLLSADLQNNLVIRVGDMLRKKWHKVIKEESDFGGFF